MKKKVVGFLGMVALMFVAVGGFALNSFEMVDLIDPGVYGNSLTEEDKLLGFYLNYSYGPNNQYRYVARCDVLFSFIDVTGGQEFMHGEEYVWVKKACVEEAKKRAHRYQNWKFEGWSVKWRMTGSSVLEMPASEWKVGVAKFDGDETSHLVPYEVYVYDRKDVSLGTLLHNGKKYKVVPL